jgi:hypothetical protein
MRREHTRDFGKPCVTPVDVRFERFELVPLGFVDRVRRVRHDQVDRVVGQLAEQLEHLAVPELAEGVLVRARRAGPTQIAR